MFSINTFRYVALAEATSFLILLVCSVLKRTAGFEEGVPVMGGIHGALFLAYVVIALSVRAGAGWTTKQTFLVLVGAVVPFGGFAVDRWLARTGQLKTA